MAIARKSNMAFFLAMATAALVMNSAAAATTYQVGDALTWVVPPGGASAYTTWASNKNFIVGDILVFTFTTGNHDVAQVTKASFDSCSATSPISLVTNGPANITLTSSGEHYYICTFSTHCSGGQKLAINVTGGSSPAPAPSTGGTPPPSPSPSPPASVPSPTPATSPPAAAPTAPSPTPATSPPAPAPTVPSPTPATSPPAPAPSTLSPPSPSAPSPSGTNPSTPTPTGSVTPPPPPPSAATSIGAAGLSATFLSIALALLF